MGIVVSRLLQEQKKKLIKADLTDRVCHLFTIDLPFSISITLSFELCWLDLILPFAVFSNLLLPLSFIVCCATVRLRRLEKNALCSLVLLPIQQLSVINGPCWLAVVVSVVMLMFGQLVFGHMKMMTNLSVSAAAAAARFLHFSLGRILIYPKKKVSILPTDRRALIWMPNFPKRLNAHCSLVLLIYLLMNSADAV